MSLSIILGFIIGVLLGFFAVASFLAFLLELRNIVDEAAEEIQERDLIRDFEEDEWPNSSVPTNYNDLYTEYEKTKVEVYEE